MTEPKPHVDAPKAFARGRRLRVLIVDDHEVVHWGFRLMLGQLPWVERCLSARTGQEAVELTKRYEPHVALIDLFVAHESGPEIGQSIRAACPGTRLLLISGAGRISRAAARAAGAAGFILKDRRAADIAHAVATIGSGGDVFETVDEPSGVALSERERDVLDLIARGATNSEIAVSLHLSPHTVKDHTSALYRKLEVRNRAEAVQRSERLGLLR